MILNWDCLSYFYYILILTIVKTMISTNILNKLITIYSTYYIASISCSYGELSNIRHIGYMYLNATFTSPSTLIFIMFPND